MVSEEKSPIAAAVLVSIVFGLSFLFTKGVLFHLLPFQLLGVRFAMAALTLTLLAGLKVVTINIHLRDLRKLLGIAVWQPVIYFVCETYGVKLTSASESSIVIALVPVATGVFSLYMLKEGITGKQAWFIGAAVGGVFFMALAGEDSSAAGANHLLGIAFLVGAVLSAALYHILSRRAAAEFKPVDITFVMMWLGAIVFNAVGITGSVFGHTLGNYRLVYQDLSVLGGLLYLGVLSSVIAFFFYNYSLSRLPASRVAVFLNLVPVVSVAAGIAVFHEHLGPWQLFGCGLILTGVWGTNYFSETRRKKKETHGLAKLDA